MRKILLAGAAAIGALALGTPASAQVVMTPQNWSPGSGAPVIQNTPGVQVRLSGRYRFYAVNTQSDFANNSGAVNGQVGDQTTGSLDFYDYGRLWPGFDVMTPGGLRYGAQLEIRLQGASVSNDRGVLKYRQMYGYVATPSLGQLRVGSSFGVIGLLGQGHIMGSIASGLWDGDGPGTIVGPGNPSTFWYSSSSFNNTTKITYLSPQFFGFDAGISYSPNRGTFDSGCGTPSGTATSNCDRLNESNIDADTQRDRNRYELALRYRGSFGPVGLSTAIGYMGSDAVGASGNAFATDGFSMLLGGANIQAFGFTVGGVVSGGKGNYATQTRGTQATGLTVGNTFRSTANLTPLPSGVGADDLFTWQIGAMYNIGAWQFGIAYHEAEYEGNVAVASEAKDKGLGIGVRYAVAPGFNIIAEYLYGTREENGVDVTNGRAIGQTVSGTTGSAGREEATTNLIMLGMAFNW
jgi:hypothetical protein